MRAARLWTLWFLLPMGAHAQGWVQGEYYRRAITVSNTAAAQPNYAVQVELDTDSLIAAGKMSGSCADLRATASDGQTLIPFWLATGCGSTMAVLWINVPSLPVGTTTVYLYYGGVSLPSVSAPEQTFLFYDDFSTNPNMRWSYIYRRKGDASQEFYWDGSRLFLTVADAGLGGGGTMLTIDPAWESGWAVHFLAKVGGGNGPGNGADGLALGFFHQGNAYGHVGGELGIDLKGYAVELDSFDDNLAPDGGRLVAGGNPSMHHVAVTQTPTLDTYGYLHLTHVNTDVVNDDVQHAYDVRFWQDTVAVFIDGAQVLNYAGAFDKTYRRLLFSAATGNLYDNHELDQVLVRRFVSPEPAILVGPEQIGGSGPPGIDGGLDAGPPPAPPNPPSGCGCSLAPSAVSVVLLLAIGFVLRARRMAQR